MDRIFSLDGQWTLFYANEENVPPSSPKELECLRLPCIPAEVPGNVELDLSRAGLLPADLYWGMNPWLAEAYEAVAEQLGQGAARFLFETGPGAICRGQALPPRQPDKEDRQWESYD